MFRLGAEPPPISRLRAGVVFAAVLLFGLVVMLVLAAAASLEGAPTPGITETVIFYGTPVVIALVGYRLLRRRGAAPRRALGLAAAIAVAIPVLLAGIFFALVVASS